MCICLRERHAKHTPLALSALLGTVLLHHYRGVLLFAAAAPDDEADNKDDENDGDNDDGNEKSAANGCGRAEGIAQVLEKFVDFIEVCADFVAIGIKAIIGCGKIRTKQDQNKGQRLLEVVDWLVSTGG